MPLPVSMTEGGLLQASDVAGENMAQPAANSSQGAIQSRRYHRGRDTHQLVVQLVPPNSRVLDVGCASGYLGVDLHTKGCTVTGIDVDSVNVAAARATRAYEQVVELNLDDTRAPLPDGPYDVLLCADILEHLVDPVGTLQRLTRLVVADGLVVVSVPNVAHVATRWNLLLGRFPYTETGTLDRTHLHLYTYRTACELVADAGLRVADVYAGSDRFGKVLSFGPRPARTLRGLLAYNIVLAARKPSHVAA
jgi:methionine biosynthesis protein MetW